MRDDPPDELPVEYRLWLDDTLGDDERAAIAARSPFDTPDLDEDWQEGLGWVGWRTNPLDWLDDAA